MEREPQVEYRTAAERAREHLLGHFEQFEFGLGPEQFDAFVSEIRTEDLSNDPWADKVGRTPIAKIEGRRLTVDHGYERFTPEQQAHVLAHEYGHALAWFFTRQPDNARYQGINELIKTLPSNEKSYYVSYLDREMEDDVDKAAFLQNEAMAELLAQYLESDRTFAGMMTAKLLEFPQGDQELPEEERAIYQQRAEEIGSVQEYLDIADNEAEREAFLAHNPKLIAHYQVWREIDSLFRETDFSQITAETVAAAEAAKTIDWTAYDAEQIFWDGYELAEEMHAEERAAPELDYRTMFGAPAGTPMDPTKKAEQVSWLWKIFV